MISSFPVFWEEYLNHLKKGSYHLNILESPSLYVKQLFKVKFT